MAPNSPIILIILMLLLICCRKEKSNDFVANEQKTIAGLLLPDTLRPIEVIDEPLENGDGVRLHRYQLDSSLYLDLEKQMRSFSSMELPFRPNEYIDNLIYDYVDDTDFGYYILKHDQEDQRDLLLIVLNKSRVELTIILSKT
jgi:hypothetical protein